MLHLSLSPIKRFLKRFAGLGFLIGGAAVINFAEYGFVCVLLVFSGLAFIVQIHDSAIFEKGKKLRVLV